MRYVFVAVAVAQLDPTCTMDMFMGSTEYKNSTTSNNTLHFDGLRVLQSSIKKLGALGLSKAKQVLFTGVAHSGTMVYLHADRVHEQIKSMNSGWETLPPPPPSPRPLSFPWRMQAGK